ncbi:MAG: glutamate mutase L [Dehalococcoidales bacterium]|nr:glutamate mutase L [Dehalococcoidales bacterium]
MDDIRLLIDFGSTFTKVVAVDLDKVEVVATARVPSTVESDITVGLGEALKKIEENTGIGDLEEREALACSSAAGGLRMVCAGFVPELTSKAANLAALGAGAKVIGCYSHKLTQQEIEEIEAASPDIVLLSGGTDGGDEQVIIHNASMVSRTGRAISNVIIAGNKTACDEIRAIFRDNSKNVLYTSNVMPEIGVLDVAPCNKEIRDLFMRNIIEAKGIARAKAIIKDVIMPTPSAVLEAARLIADGYGDAGGFGDLIVIDVGGATTDVHSIAQGKPARPDTIIAGLHEPYEKRTVEGDLGLRYNLDRLLELVKERETPPNFDAIVKGFHEGKLPQTGEEKACHLLLSCLTMEVAVSRHAGRIEVVYGPTGETLVQHGKDLTHVKTVIGTGGPVVFSGNRREILEHALFREDNPFVLKPRDPDLYIDEQYILYAVGLLSQVEPEKALNLARKYLKRI